MSIKLKGNFALLGAVIIWSGWMIQTRYLALGSLAPFDLAALRFSFAAAFLLPVAIKKGLVFTNGKFWQGLALSACLGVPYMLIVATGMKFAPASHGASIINGAMVMTSVLLSYYLNREKPSIKRIVGISIIFLGLALLIIYKVSSFNRGHFLFLAGGFMWGLYSFLIKKWRVDPLHATAIVGIYSAIIYIPIYLVFLKTDQTLVSSMLLAHGIYQGGFASCIALFLFSYGVSTLGAERASLYMPIVPVFTTILAILLLGENPKIIEIAAITGIVMGFLIAIIQFPKKN